MSNPYSQQPFDPQFGSANQTGPYQQMVPPDRTNTLAIVSLVSALFVPLVGIITGHIALSQIKRTRESGRGLALAGTIIGYLLTALYIILIALLVLTGAGLSKYIADNQGNLSEFGISSTGTPGSGNEIAASDSISGVTVNPEICAAVTELLTATGDLPLVPDASPESLKAEQKLAQKERELADLIAEPGPKNVVLKPSILADSGADRQTMKSAIEDYSQLIAKLNSDCSSLEVREPVKGIQR